MSSLTTLVLLLACAPGTVEVAAPEDDRDPAGTDSEPTTEPTTEPDTDPPDTAATTDEDTAGSTTSEPEEPTVSTEELPDSPTAGESFFLDDVIHPIELQIAPEAFQALRVDPRTYAPATFIHDGVALEVAIRAKGNTQFRAIDDKPSLVIDFNRVVEDQTFHGLPSVYLHNMTYDPSMMHEHLAYWYLRELGVPASRTTYARLTVNGADYGMYIFVEKQNRVYKERFWGDTSGSLFETGSFNHGCDLNDVSGAVACDCFEIDDIGSEANPIGELDRLCRVASTVSSTWYEDMRDVVDMDVFLLAQAGEIVTAHFDNYGWNGNNWRIYHEPTEDLWYWTPWSTDLSYGWYPWSGRPHCGEYGQSIYEYSRGYLMSRCWNDASCRADLEAAIAVAADRYEALDVPAEIDRVLDMIGDGVRSDTRRWYDDTWFEQEVDCGRDWAAARPAAVRAEL